MECFPTGIFSDWKLFWLETLPLASFATGKISDWRLYHWKLFQNLTGCQISTLETFSLLTFPTGKHSCWNVFHRNVYPWNVFWLECLLAGMFSYWNVYWLECLLTGIITPGNFSPGNFSHWKLYRWKYYNVPTNQYQSISTVAIGVKWDEIQSELNIKRKTFSIHSLLCCI